MGKKYSNVSLVSNRWIGNDKATLPVLILIIPVRSGTHEEESLPATLEEGITVGAWFWILSVGIVTTLLLTSTSKVASS